MLSWRETAGSGAGIGRLFILLLLTMVGSSRELRLKPLSMSRWCNSTSADITTRGAPNPIPAQATESSIHAATTMTTPGATST
jgi:hypothetical protein